MTPIPSTDVIVLSGAPGVGKTSLALAVRDLYGAVHLDLPRIRSFHLPCDWSGANAVEEAMAVRVLMSMAWVYLRHGRVPMVLDDLRDEDAVRAAHELASSARVRLISLVADDDLLAARLTARCAGFRDFGEALARNAALRRRPLFGGEVRLDTSGGLLGEAVADIMN